jgi:hypothetical protein
MQDDACRIVAAARARAIGRAGVALVGARCMAAPTLRSEPAMRFLVAAFALASLVAACQSTKSAEAPSPSTEPAPAPAADAGVADAPRPWANGEKIVFEELPDNLKGAYMKEVVLPKMKDVFQQFDAKEYADFGCKTCHGENAKQRAFEMPSPEIHVLDFQKDKVDHAAEYKFMSETVAPTMAGLLGEQPFDPATGKGFGCMGCHTIQK